MINIFEVLKKQVEMWQAQNDCVFCFADFEAPLRVSDLNESIAKTGQECCVRTFMTNYNVKPVRSQNNAGQSFVSSINHSFLLWVIIPDEVDYNVHVEQKGHDVNESKIERIINKLLVCASNINICEIEPSTTISDENIDIVIDAFDMNYTGLKIKYTLNEKVWN